MRKKQKEYVLIFKGTQVELPCQVHHNHMKLQLQGIRHHRLAFTAAVLNLWVMTPLGVKQTFQWHCISNIYNS